MRKIKLMTTGLSVLASALLLTACGGSDSSDTTTTPDVPPISQAPVSARDGFNVVTPNEPGYVDLSSLIESGVAGAKVTGVYLESSQGSGQCGEVSTDDLASDQGFSVTVEGAAICEYGYEVESVALAGQTKTRARAKVMVASSAGGAAVLPPISIAMAIDDLPRVTDIKAELEAKGSFPTGYILSENFSVLGDGYVTMVATDFSITYRAEAEGVSRVVYALESVDPDAPDIKMGTLDYAVSDSLNNAPTASSFAYNADEINTSYEIDLSADNHIDDSDGDGLQLVEVQSYTATVAAKDPNDLSNTVLTFTSLVGGKHYVTYVVSDQHGGFATGIIEVSVANQDQMARWSDIENDQLLFTAPQTKFEMDIEAAAATYQGNWIDTGYTPNISMSTFSSVGAEAYCATRGRLPTVAEIQDLYNVKSPASSYSWPMGQGYLALDGTSFSVVSLLDNKIAQVNGGLYYATCVDSGGPRLLANKNTAIANDVDTVELTASFVRDTGPVVGAVLSYSLSSSPEKTVITTDEQGEAKFSVKSTQAGTAAVNLEYVNNTSETVRVSTDINFIGDIDTAEVVSMVVINDNAAADGLAMNKYGVTLHDFYGNPVGGALIKLEKDSVTADLFENPLGLISGVDGQVIFNLTDSIEERVEVTASFTNAGGAFTSESRYSVFSDPICSDVISGEILFVCPKKHNDASLRSVEAEDYCNDTGTRLPTINELLALFQENGHMGTAYGWNMGDYYWSSTMDGQGRTYDFNLTNGSVSNNNPADISKFACVSDGGEIDTARVASLTIEEDNARANTIERNVIEITLLDSEDRPVPGANINVQLGSNTVSTDEDIALLVSDGRGQVRLHLANTVGEPVAVEVSYTGYISGFTSLSTTSQFAAPLPFTYPLTEQEAIEQGVPYSSTQRENGSYGPDDVTFARMNWAEASSFCINQGKRLPSFDELELLYADEGNMWTALGWPTYWAYWTSTEHDTNPDYHWEVRLHDNSTSTQHNNNSRYVTCTN